MNKYLKVNAVLGLTLAMLVTGCSGSSTDSSESADSKTVTAALNVSDAEVETSETTAEAESSAETSDEESSDGETSLGESDSESDVTLSEKNFYGIDLLVPDDMEIVVLDGSMLAWNEANTEMIYASNIEETTGTAAEVTEDKIQEMLENEFTDVSILQFASDVEINDLARVTFAQVTMKNQNGTTINGLIYIFFYTGNGMQVLEILYEAGSGTALEENIDEIYASVYLGDNFKAQLTEYLEKKADSSSSSSSSSKSSSTKKTNPYADSGYVVRNSWGQVPVPASWNQDVYYDEGERTTGGYWFKIIDKASYDAGSGGTLATIMLMPQNEDYTVIPDAEFLGTFKGLGKDTYNVVVSYPTDAQFIPKTAASYQAKAKIIEDVVSGFEALKDYTFNPASKS